MLIQRKNLSFLNHLQIVTLKFIKYSFQLPFPLGKILLVFIAAVECGEPDGNSNALNGEATLKRKIINNDNEFSYDRNKRIERGLPLKVVHTWSR